MMWLWLCVKKARLGWIFESQTASELTTVEILVCSLDLCFIIDCILFPIESLITCLNSQRLSVVTRAWAANEQTDQCKTQTADRG